MRLSQCRPRWTENKTTAPFWVVVPCNLVEIYRCFRGACCLHHQGDESSSWRYRQYITRRNNPEDTLLHIRRRQNLKSHQKTSTLHYMAAYFTGRLDITRRLKHKMSIFRCFITKALKTDTNTHSMLFTHTSSTHFSMAQKPRTTARDILKLSWQHGTAFPLYTTTDSITAFPTHSGTVAKHPHCIFVTENSRCSRHNESQ
jgi:hypothetical protein